MSHRLGAMPLFALLVAPLLAAAQDVPHYVAAFDAGSSRIAVQLCLAQAHPRVAFAIDSKAAMRYVHELQRGKGRAIESGDAEWIARDWHAGECLAYQADIAGIAERHEPDVGWRMGDDLVAAPQYWLLRADVQRDADADIQVELPPGWNISAPWRELGRDGKSIRFDIPNTPADWSSAVAFGKFTEEPIALPGGVLRLTILHGATEAEREKLRTWLDRVAHAVLSAYGRLPLAEVQVLMIPVGKRQSAVLFGQSIRGEGNALQLLVDPSHPAADFADDWMAVHELSHLMHPYLGDRGSWLAEGLATYFQNVLRGRSGLLTPAQTWDRMTEGFHRGAAGAADETLEHAAQNMHRNHAFQRVYWAGTVYWLTVDRDLRRRSGGKLTLDDALARFRDCCLPAYREWAPDEFVARLDALLGVDIFVPRYREFAQMRRFPDWEKVYSELGIRTDGDRLTFDAHARDAAIRDAITAPAQKRAASR